MRKTIKITASLSEWTELNNSFQLLQQTGLPIRLLLIENVKIIAEKVHPILITINELLQHNVILDGQGKLSIKQGVDKDSPRKYSDYVYIDKEKESLVLKEIGALRSTQIEIELVQWSLERPFMVDGEKLPLSSVLEQSPFIQADGAVLNQLMDTILYFDNGDS